MSFGARHARLFCLLLAGETIFALPFHLPRFFRPQLLEALGVSNTTLGDAFALYGVVAMLAYFPGGMLADRYPARALLACALWATGFGGVLLAGFPSAGVLAFLYAGWGLTTILLCWAALLRATREWGGPLAQGRAFGVLEAGRGAVAAVLANLAVLLLARAVAAGLAEPAALRVVVLFYTAVTLLAGFACWRLLPADTLAPSHATASGHEPIEPSLRAVLPSRWDTARMMSPRLGWHALLLVAAYCGYKSLDYVTLFLVSVHQLDANEAAELFSLSAWLRPIAALLAGFAADRVGTSKVTARLFVAAALGAILLALFGSSPLSRVLPLLGGLVFCVCALRGVYFALLEEMKLPAYFTGTAIGMVSVVGYLPDVFFAPLAGRILDRTPGVGGFFQLYALLAAILSLGFLASVMLRRQIARA